jgi:hypothetical protein
MQMRPEYNTIQKDDRIAERPFTAPNQNRQRKQTKRRRITSSSAKKSPEKLPDPENKVEPEGDGGALDLNAR